MVKKVVKYETCLVERRFSNHQDNMRIKLMIKEFHIG